MKWFLLGLLVLESCVYCILLLMNLNYSTHKDRQIPPILADKITPERFELSKNYLTDKTKMEIMKSIIKLLVTILVLLLLAPLFEKIALQVSTNYILQGLLFFGMIGLIRRIFSIFFDYKKDFFIEQKYGFNKTTKKTFVSDHIKQIFIDAIINSILYGFILYILYSYSVWWWRFSLISGCFFLFLQIIIPILILPFTVKVKPLPEGELKKQIRDFAIKKHFDPSKIFVMVSSNRSTHAGASLVGIGKSMRILLTDTILESPPDEVLAVISHEIGHAKHFDIWKQCFVIITELTIIFYLANILFTSGIISKLFSISAPFAILFYVMAFVFLLFFFMIPLLNFVIRQQEFNADLYAIRSVQRVGPFINFLKKLVSDSLVNVNPLPLYKLWFENHPAPVDRILAVLNHAKMENIGD